MREDADRARQRAYTEAGATLLPVPPGPLGLDIAAAMQALGKAGLTRVLVEGGGQLAAALMRADHYGWFERADRGVYRVTPKGSAALHDHRDECARLATNT